ncbi:Hypothetical predicted protein [Pelobates cultripes]|uniref:Uncharacterized protein n=1 Tax=Pelobates cultripes TaxID=61616 RepID=A0AAD1S5S0_PELCU|nr:Hypothetical predicted protein [Pelobates cultripes]
MSRRTQLSGPSPSKVMYPADQRDTHALRQPSEEDRAEERPYTGRAFIPPINNHAELTTTMLKAMQEGVWVSLYCVGILLGLGLHIGGEGFCKSCNLSNLSHSQSTTLYDNHLRISNLITC